MSELTLKAWDTINGASGKCYANIEGNIEDMIYVKNIEAKIDKNKKEIPVLGYTGTKHKSTGWKGSGSMSIYYVTSIFRSLMMDYIKTGKDTYFDLFIENSDPSSETGKQKIWLKQVNLDGVIIGKLDINSTELDEEVNFTFNGVEIIDEFEDISGE